MRFLVEPSRRIPVRCEADVVVAGAGLSGVAAAVASSRAGARTLLIERYGFPGGTSTAGLMSSITNFYVTRRNQQVVGGVAKEILQRLGTEGGVGSGPFTQNVPQIPNDPEKMKVALIQILEEASVEVLYHSFIAGARVRGGRLGSILVENKAGRSAIAANAFVDATGDADLCWMSGARVETLRANGSLQFRMANVDLERLVEYFLANPSEYDGPCDVETSLQDFERNWRERRVFHVPHGNGRKMSVVQAAVSSGSYPTQLGLVTWLDAFGMYGFGETRTVTISTGFVTGDLLDPFVLSQAESDARKAVLVAARFLVENVPGFEGAYLAQTAGQLGIRFTRRIVGHYTLTEADREAFRRFDDVVAVVTERKIGGPRYEGAFDVPYRILLPLGVHGLLAASGKSASTEPPGALRGQVACMQLGQACGVAAATCSKLRGRANKVSIRDVQKELLRQGVYLGDAERLNELGLQ